MSYAKIMMSAAAFGLMSSTALAQYNTVVEPITQPVQTVDQLPIEYNEHGVMKAQHIKPGDISPEEYQRLLNEADKIRAFRSNSGSYDSVSYDAVTTTEQNITTVTDANGYEIQLFSEPTAQPAPVTYAGTQTIVTSPEPLYTTTDVSVPVTQSHSVAKGDTLYNISKRFGVKVDDIRTTNGLAGNNLKIGQLLQIPSAGTTISARSYQVAPATISASTQTITEPAPRSSRVIRTVQPIPSNKVYAILPKDNLYQISKRACTTVDAIASLNGITDFSTLQPGQKIILPEGSCLK